MAQRPASLLGAAGIQSAESAVVLAASVLAGVDAATGQSYRLASGVALTVIGLVTTGLLVLVAAGLAGARRWSRTPALLTQLFTGIVAIYLIQGGRYEWGVPALVLAIVGLAALLVPPSLRALTGDHPAPPDQKPSAR